MTVSHARRRLALAGLLVALPALAWAQGAPMPLDPAHKGEADGAMTQLKVVPSPLLEAPTSPPPPPGGKFDVEELKAPDPEAVGVLDDKQGGLGPALWKGATSSEVRALLPRLPAAMNSRAMRGLERRLLLTAAVPEGNKGQTPLLLELRAERLYALGEIEGLNNLLKSAPQSLTSATLSKIKTDTYLLAGDTKSACAESATQVGAVDPRMQIFCDMSNGRVLEANLALDLMRERKDADHGFIAAAEVMGGLPPAKLDKLANPGALHLAAFRAAKMPLPADAATGAPPAMLRAIADSTAQTTETRLAAAERAEAMGLLDSDALRKLYTGLQPSQAEQQAAQSQGDKLAAGRALLLRVALNEAQPVVKADLVSRVLGSAAERGQYPTTARLYAPIIADMKQTPELAPVAATFAKALLIAGRPEAANGWLTLAKQDPAAAKSADDLWLALRLAKPMADPFNADGFKAWKAAKALGPDAAERRQTVALELLAALGDKVPAAEWLALAQTPGVAGPQPKPALKAMLRAAAEGNHVGETVLLALICLGEGGPDKADPDLLNRVIAALKAVGLERDARDLALEVAWTQ
jgi:hypothetical protein